jgi:hypothetical protein
MEWMTYKQAHTYETEAHGLGVSKIARGRRGFMRAYEKHSRGKGQQAAERAMEKATVPGYPGQSWSQRRAGFIARWLPVYRRKRSRRIALALAMWAYKVPEL